jgi:hypothetical protein
VIRKGGPASVTLALIGTALLAAGLWQGASAFQEGNAALEVAAPEEREEPATPAASAPAAKTPSRETPAPAAPLARAITPMAQRVAVLGILNKRNGLSREISLRPGQATRVGNLVVRLRACETTAPWEPEKLTGAFVQADLRGTDDKWRRIFSGWLYKESPSLNVVENQIYDIWPKSCVMRHPDIGPETVSASAPSTSPKRSSAKKSAAGGVNDAPAPPAAPTSPIAESSNPT